MSCYLQTAKLHWATRKNEAELQVLSQNTLWSKSTETRFPTGYLLKGVTQTDSVLHVILQTVLQLAIFLPDVFVHARRKTSTPHTKPNACKGDREGGVLLHILLHEFFKLKAMLYIF